MSGSEVARFRREQALQEQAAQQGLYGLAVIASHESITHRMELGADRLQQLFEAGKAEEAIALLSTKQWC